MFDSFKTYFELLISLSWLPLLLVIAFLVVAWLVLRQWFLLKARMGDYSRYQQQSLQLFLITLSILLVILSAPIQNEMRGQLLSLFGLLVSAVIALSSTTVMGNLMAGLMLRVVKSFAIGDFVRVSGQLGRVSATGLLHVEVQTEDSNLLTFPNLVLIQQPFTVIRASGTMIQCEISLGYDISRHEIEKALLKAVTQIELTDGFVEIKALGDYSVTYAVHARLSETKKLISTRARLKAAVLDQLHAANIEIVSPNFMNQRQLDPQKKILPPVKFYTEEGNTHIEDVMFDKAGRAEMVKRLEKRLAAVKKRVLEIENEREKADQEDCENINEKLARWKRREAQVQFLLDETQVD